MSASTRLFFSIVKMKKSKFAFPPCNAFYMFVADNNLALEAQVVLMFFSILFNNVIYVFFFAAA